MTVQTLAGELYLSTMGSEFQSVLEPWSTDGGVGSLPEGECRPPNAGSPDLLPLVATNTGFVALIPTKNDLPYGTWPVCEPPVWLADPDGAWVPTTQDSPFGPGAFVYDLSWHDGMFVAVGGISPRIPLVWVSSDAITWETVRLPPVQDAEYELRNVEGGPCG